MARNENLKTVVAKSAPFQEMITLVDKKKNPVVKNCLGSAPAFFVAALAETTGKPMICIFTDEDEAKCFFDDLSELLVDEEINFFSALGKQAWNEIGPQSPLVGRRLQTIKSFLGGRGRIIITSVQALLEKIASPEDMKSRRRLITTGSTVDFQKFIAYLLETGYIRELKVERPGEMSIRGGIIDIFQFEEENPVRIEFNGETIESIRRFDLDSQNSIFACSSVDLLPVGAGGLYGPYIDQPVDRPPLGVTLLEYLQRQTIVVYRDKTLINNSLMDYYRVCRDRFHTFIAENGLAEEITFQEYYGDVASINRQLNLFNYIDFKLINTPVGQHAVDCLMKKSGQFAGNLQVFRNEIEFIERFYNDTDTPYHLLLACESPNQAERMQELLQQEGFPPQLQTVPMNISEGFQWPDQRLYIFTNRELYGRIRSARGDKLSRRAIVLEELRKFKENDFVVHIDYGVGIFRGLQRISAYGKSRECIQIEYADGDMLYVPLEKMDRVQKYSTREGYSPVLNKLGTKDWEKLKSRTKQKVKDVAEKLIKLYATRKLNAGIAFSPDTIWQKELEASFPYEETIDQMNAIVEIKQDMEAPIPMDRLICGDVGFGKTEVAVRAAFKALNDNKQVAVLVPTTVLAQQHKITFTERLGRFPVKIEVLSRFKTAAQQQEVIRRLAFGDIDLIIGTHRLLSKDIQFKELGLLIVDEEHKFGVLHKERLKLLKMNVDTITLTATPIPRTMHMALMGVRDLSIINTPPHNRLSIHTEVCRFEKEFIREVVLRECDRGGQVFFVHNRVATIRAMEQLLKELLPEISIATAHGQMPGNVLEKIMFDYVSGKVQCLVSTMIIESGIDVPNANTLIVNRADKFGLSQLYQLRGRVGRSNQQAFAYFLIPPLRKLTRNAIKRLQTIQEYSHLGSGYKIAMRDLEIRGAGNIFGAEQSGFINALGFELFTQIIEEAIKELHDGIASNKTSDDQDRFESRIEITSPALLPSDYVPSAEDRVDLYRRLIEAKEEEGIEEIAKEIRDRFGPLPQPAINLIEYLSLKELARRAFVEEISFKDGVVIGKFGARFIPRGEQFRPWIGKMVKNAQHDFEFKQEKNQLIFTLRARSDESSMAQVKNFLQNII